MPTNKHSIMLGDILPPLNSVITDLGEPVNLANYTVKFRLLDSSNAVVLNDVTGGVTVHPTQIFTAAATGLATCYGHGVKEGDQVIVANSGGGLPTGLVAVTRYFAVQVTPNAFGLAATPGGQSVITAAGTGTNTFYIVGSAQFDFGATEVDEAGTFKGFWRLYSGSEISTFPKGQGEYIPIEVVALGT